MAVESREKTQLRSLFEDSTELVGNEEFSLFSTPTVEKIDGSTDLVEEAEDLEEQTEENKRSLVADALAQINEFDFESLYPTVSQLESYYSSNKDLLTSNSKALRKQARRRPNTG